MSPLQLWYFFRINSVIIAPPPVNIKLLDGISRRHPGRYPGRHLGPKTFTKFYARTSLTRRRGLPWPKGVLRKTLCRIISGWFFSTLLKIRLKKQPIKKRSIMRSLMLATCREHMRSNHMSCSAAVPYASFEAILSLKGYLFSKVIF